MKIGISIVHFGEQQVLDKCLNSLGEIGGSKIFETLVFNCNENNVGFTIANNILIKDFYNRNIADQPDWIWLLNNDTTVPKETLDAIEKVLPTLQSDIGIIGFQIRSMDNPDFIHHAGTGQCFPNGIHKTGSVKLGHCQDRTFEKWVTFASVLIRREVFEEIGLLDKNMKFICSDSDFCYRARHTGWKIIYEPSFIIYHKIGESQAPNPIMASQMQSDTIVFQNKWLNGKSYFDLTNELLNAE
jgi:GT2 family glycosyltransferase